MPVCFHFPEELNFANRPQYTHRILRVVWGGKEAWDLLLPIFRYVLSNHLRQPRVE